MALTMNVPETLLATADGLIDWRHAGSCQSRAQPSAFDMSAALGDNMAARYLARGIPP
jgi:hypothetical protein